MSIEVRNLSKRFGSFSALRDVSLEVRPGELLALLGPSGSGKTTLLRVIAGLEMADTGQVLFHGEDATNQHVRERQVGFVFQHYALFRNMSILENVAFGLRVRPKKFRPSDEEIRRRVHELLKLVQLDWLADRYPHQLSGGSVNASRWLGPWQWSRMFYFWMSPSARWTQGYARSCGHGCGGCMMTCTSPACSSPTIRKKRWRLRTGWLS